MMTGMTDNGYGEEWQYDHPRRCECCDRLLNKQDGFEEWLGYFTCEKCGCYNEWSTDDEDEDDDDEEESSESYSGYRGPDLTYDNDDDEEEEEVGSYFDSEEYKRRVQAEARRKKEQELKQEELRKAKEAERQQKLAQKKEQRKRLWRTITGKKQVIGLSSEQCRRMHYEEVVSVLKSQEFYNISVSYNEDLSPESRSLEGTVEHISINGTTAFDAAAQFPFNAKISIVYHMLKTARPPLTTRSAKRMDIEDVAWEFSNAGFKNIYREAISDLKRDGLSKKTPLKRLQLMAGRISKRMTDSDWMRRS